MSALLGHRVILAEAVERGREVLGTVISDEDAYPERGLVLVRHETGRERWRRPSELRVLGDPEVPASNVADLAWDLWLEPPAHLDSRIAALHEAWRTATAQHAARGET